MSRAALLNSRKTGDVAPRLRVGTADASCGFVERVESACKWIRDHSREYGRPCTEMEHRGLKMHISTPAGPLTSFGRPRESQKPRFRELRGPSMRFADPLSRPAYVLLVRKAEQETGADPLIPGCQEHEQNCTGERAYSSTTAVGLISGSRPPPISLIAHS